jgi:hypothetical protein
MTSERLDKLSERLKQFAKVELRGYSPFYEKLTLQMSEDREMLELASHMRGGQPPQLLHAAVHFLLLNGELHELREFYPNLANNVRDGDPYPVFRSFCLTHAKAIREIISTRRVQTNVVERCACLLPAFSLISLKTDLNPLSIVEIGSSAGLNLLWDKYSYEYGDTKRYGDPLSQVKVVSRFTSDLLPKIPRILPEVLYRVGLEVNPVDINDTDATAWLRALVWPDHKARFERLTNAITIAQACPPTVLHGDALYLLPQALSNAPEDTALCVFHTHTTYQFSTAARERLDAFLSDFGKQRNLYWLSMEYRQHGHQRLSDDDGTLPTPTLELVSFENGVRKQERLATCHPHAAWIEWKQKAPRQNSPSCQ